ncbi:MAG: S8 family serine peptidase, partial [Firmicutes bacterium]|nr:S8 family serine peptidase [Bacillota bacterium]
MKRVLGFLVLILALFGSGCLGWLGVGPGREPKLLLRLEEPFPGETVEIFLRTEGQEYLLVLKEEREQELTLEAGLWKIEAQARDSQGRLIGFSGEYPLHIEKKTHLLELGIELVDPRPALPQAVDLQARWEQEGVLLSWANKEKQGQWEVWRRRLESRLWKKIAVLPAEQASFSDTAISTGSAYEYALRYLDEESAPGPLGPEAATSRGTLKISWEFKHDYSFLPQEPAPRSLRIWSSLGPKSGFQDYIAYFQTEPAYERREDLLKEAGWKIKAELTSLAAVLVEPLKKSAPLRLEGDGFYLEPNWEIAAEEALLGLKSSFAWNLELIKLPLAWEISQGSRGLPIALLDSGLDPNFSGAAVYPGYNFVQGNRDTADDNGHGTQVAGILKQVVPRLGIIPVKVLDEKGSGNVFDLAAGLLFAAGLHDQLYNPYPAAVINLSLGQFNSSTILRGAIRHIAEKTAALLVAAAGNYDRPEVLYPAAYPEVIAVGAIAPAAGLPRRADYSNFGSGLDLTAPGGSREFPLESPGLP